MISHHDPYPILNAVGANGAGNPIYVPDFRHIILALDTTGTTTATIKIQGSLQKTPPTWGSAQSPTNQWDYLRITDLEDMSGLDGDTGIVLSGADANRMFEVEINGMLWINAIVSNYSQGTLYLKGFPRGA